MMLLDVPNEILYVIFAELNIIDLISIYSSCKKCHLLLQDQYFFYTYLNTYTSVYKHYCNIQSFNIENDYKHILFHKTDFDIGDYKKYISGHLDCIAIKRHNEIVKKCYSRNHNYKLQILSIYNLDGTLISSKEHTFRKDPKKSYLEERIGNNIYIKRDYKNDIREIRYNDRHIKWCYDNRIFKEYMVYNRQYYIGYILHKEHVFKKKHKIKKVYLCRHKNIDYLLSESFYNNLVITDQGHILNKLYPHIIDTIELIDYIKRHFNKTDIHNKNEFLYYINNIKKWRICKIY